MAAPDLTTVVGGGALAVLILREVFAFLKVKRTNGSGDKSVEYWTQEIRKIVREEVREGFDRQELRNRGRHDH